MKVGTTDCSQSKNCLSRNLVCVGVVVSIKIFSRVCHYILILESWWELWDHQVRLKIIITHVIVIITYILGSGKTTLLDLLTGRRHTGTVSVSINFVKLTENFGFCFRERFM